MIIINVIHGLFMALQVYILRKNLTLGNYFGGMVGLVIILFFIGLSSWPIICLALALGMFIPGVTNILAKIPSFSTILRILGQNVTFIARIGVPREKIEEAIYKATGHTYSELKESHEKFEQFKRRCEEVRFDSTLTEEEKKKKYEDIRKETGIFDQSS